MKKIGLLVAMTFAVGAVAIARSAAPEGEDGLSGSMKIAGSSTVYPITVAVAEEFSKLHTEVEIAVQSTGTGGGFKNFFVPGMTENQRRKPSH